VRTIQWLLLALHPPLSVGWTAAVVWRKAGASYTPLVIFAVLPLMALAIEPFAPPPRALGRMALALAELVLGAMCAMAVSIAIVRSVGW